MKNKHSIVSFKKLALGFFLVQSVCFSLFSQSLDSIQNLEGVTISAASRPRISPNIGQLQSLNASSLERLNAIQLSDAVKFFAGAMVKDYGGIGGLKTVSVRSLGASHTGVFVDKIPTNNAMNGQIDLSRFTLDNIGEIRLSNDNFSSTLQTASFYSKSAQLSLITARPTFGENQHTDAEVSLKVGSFGLFNPQFNIHQKIKKQLFSLNADYQRAKGNYPFKLVHKGQTIAEIRENSAVESYRLDLKWQNFSDSRHQYFVNANYYDNHRQLPGSVTVYNPNSSKQKLWDKEKTLQGQYNYRFLDNTEILFNTKISETFNRYIDLGHQPVDNQFTQMEYFGSGGIQTREFWGFQTSLSSDIIYHKMHSNLPRFVYPTRLTSMTNWTWNAKWRSFLFYRSLLHKATFEHAESDNVAKNRQKISPTLGLNFQPKVFPNFSARFFYKETYRIPTFNELYYRNVGNTNLSPELARQFNLGVSVGKSVEEKKYMAISIDGYRNKVKDKIVAIPMNNLFTWSMVNVGEVDILGIDATLKGGFDVSKKLDFYSEINYSFQDAKDVTPSSKNYNHQIPYTPKHSGSAIFGANMFFTLQYSLMFSGERYSLQENSIDTRLEPFFDHGFSISKQISLRKINLKTAFEILNFTNKNYEIVAWYPMPGRHYRLTVRARLAP
ncbi:MAG: TonB-dependent receptor plug domain-containing protein [Bacteroidales bacterium]|jgi:outer membrane cobalamin receptor|nr:TonB-dependent receptor plug domain-containing protein [Bacteroidales bacterium]